MPMLSDTASRRLADDVQHLLLRLGIVARLYTRVRSYRGGQVTGFVVTITGGGTLSYTALLYQGLLEAEAKWSGMPAEAQGPLWLGVPTPYFFDKLDGDVARLFAAAREALAGAGHSISEVSIAHVERTPDVYLAVMLAEASWYHAPLLRDHADKYSPGVRLFEGCMRARR